MSLSKNEIKTYFGRCRCCLSYGYLKNMWTEHEHEGEREVYGEMLIQCFALSWDHSEDSIKQDQICEQCVICLRVASQFKKIVLDSQEEFLQQINAENVVKVEVDEKYQMTSLETAGVLDTLADVNDTGNTSECDNGETYEEIEYLEDEELAEPNQINTEPSHQVANVRSRKKRTSPPEQNKDDEGVPKRKWPKKLPKDQRLKTYRQYSEETLRQCLDSVRKGELTPSRASMKYNIPKWTISYKLKQDPSVDVDSNKEKMYLLVKDIKSILTFTNATPFKTKWIRYFCAYCSTDGPFFEEPDDLRTHTRTEHMNERTEKIEYFMRPYWKNEVLKLDIENLLCTVCCIVINSWNDMFKHLREKHNVILDQAYTRVIPYTLRNELQCALCKEPYTNFPHLDGHMNAHYNNHVCDDCGDTFVTLSRLRDHALSHDIGKFSCGVCNKQFKLEKYKRKHEELVHQKLSKFKCLYCSEKFSREYHRHLHCLEKHKEKIKTITCDICGKIFTWRQYYINHLHKKHGNKKYKCKECDVNFLNYGTFKEHNMVSHGKTHECDMCHKMYVSLSSLKQHMRQHDKKK